MDDIIEELLVDTSSSDDDDISTMSMIKKLKAMSRVQHQPAKIPMMTSEFRGSMWVDELLRGHPQRMYNCFGMHSGPFLNLCKLIADRGMWQYRPQQRVDLKESLAIFLYCVKRDQKHIDLAEHFQHSTETSDRHVKIMSRILCRLAKDVIRPLSEDVHENILYNPAKFPYFADCLGAIDGTCISANASSKNKEKYRTRKNTISQNVMAVVDHDMRFVFVHAGWEGSAHDARVFYDAILRPELGFPWPRNKDKYYLVDSGYPNHPGFITLYKGKRYHKSDWAGNYNFNGPRELFNHRHSSIRNVVERTFGVLKKRFPMLSDGMPPYKATRQIDLVIACCVLHNYIRDKDRLDRLFMIGESGSINADGSGEGTSREPDVGGCIQASQVGNRQWIEKRDQIADSMWQDYTCGWMGGNDDASAETE